MPSLRNLAPTLVKPRVRPRVLTVTAASTRTVAPRAGMTTHSSLRLWWRAHTPSRPWPSMRAMTSKRSSSNRTRRWSSPSRKKTSFCSSANIYCVFITTRHNDLSYPVSLSLSVTWVHVALGEYKLNVWMIQGYEWVFLSLAQDWGQRT